MPLKQRKQLNENNVIKNPNWKEADEWVYVKRVGFECGATKDRSIQWLEEDSNLEPQNYHFQRIRHWH